MLALYTLYFEHHRYIGIPFNLHPSLQILYNFPYRSSSSKGFVSVIHDTSQYEVTYNSFQLSPPKHNDVIVLTGNSIISSSPPSTVSNLHTLLEPYETIHRLSSESIVIPSTKSPFKKFSSHFLNPTTASRSIKSLLLPT